MSAGTTNTASVTVTLSCFDPDGETLTYEVVTPPSRGTLAGIVGNAAQLRPAALGTTGVDSFQYRARVRACAPIPATASISVAGDARPRRPAAAVVAAARSTTLASTTTINWLGFKKYTKLAPLVGQEPPERRDGAGDLQDQRKKQQQKGCAYKSRRFTTLGARARQPEPAQAVRQEADPGRHEDHDHDHRARLPPGKQIRYTTRMRARSPKSWVRCLLCRLEGRELRL